MERPREELARPYGRHPARTRRKRKQRRALRPMNVWQTEVHWNPLTAPATIGTSALFAGAMFVPILVPALRDAPTWLITAALLALFAAVLTTPFYTALFLHWRVTDELITATQPSRGATMTRTFDNHSITSITERGPFAIVRVSSGKQLVWPRWLVHEWVVHRWHLEGGRLSLQAQSSTNS